MTARTPQVITESLGGSALAQAVARGAAPDDWYARRPASDGEWARRASEVARSAPGDWLSALAPALNASGRAAERLDAVARGNGVLVTTGQQPGLFGGPVYTWSKALSAIALADALEDAIGIPVAPLFWAATDDSDFAEASWTVIAGPAGAEELRMPSVSGGASMAEVPLGDVSELIDRFERSARSAAWRHPLQVVRGAYRSHQTVGGAYVELLRAMLQPLGMAVLDAAHPAVRIAGAPLLREALLGSGKIAVALAERDAALVEAGHTPQVAQVAGLSLVFRAGAGSRQRIKETDARSTAGSAEADGLSPNVLLRPVMERAILPTVAYVAGPGEMAYFAQVDAVAKALGAARPLAVPRWSCTILEPHVAELLARLRLDREALRDPYAAETQVARGRLPEPVSSALAQLRASLDESLSALAEADDELVSAAAIDGARRSMAARIARLERRYTAAMKRRLTDVVQQIGAARGSLYPRGKRQERVLNLLPLLARYGEPLLTEMQGAAREHAASLLGGGARGDRSAAHPAHTAPST